jgi:hypothetical protein
MYYLQTDFDLSDAARKFTLSQYRDRFTENFYHGEDTRECSPQRQLMWKNSIVGREINEFLQQYGCNIHWDEIVFFISNTSELFLGNPHIDSKLEENERMFTHQQSSRIKTRFNVRILGNPLDTMTWWEHMQFGDTRLVTHEFKYITGETYFSKNIPGNTMRERWDYLGEPSHTANNYLMPSAFVKTDCAHTVTCSPGPRLILAFGIDKTIQELVDFRANNI